MDQVHQIRIYKDQLICQKENHNQSIAFITQDADQMNILLCKKCTLEQNHSSQLLTIEQARQIMEERRIKKNLQAEEMKNQCLKHLKDYEQQILSYRASVLFQIDETLSFSQNLIQEIQKFKVENEIDFIKEIQEFQFNNEVDNLKQFRQSIIPYFTKVLQKFKDLIAIDLKYCKEKIRNIYDIVKDPSQKNFKVKSVEQVYSLGQTENTGAIAFNYQGNIMVAGCDEKIKVFKFQNGMLLEDRKLIGHTNVVYCLLFSKKCNWFASGSYDNTIRCWKENQNEWISSKSQKYHTDSVFCMIINQNEDTLISCSLDRSIKVWKVDCDKNELQYDYTLENKHSDRVYCISMNKSETSLVSCSYDCKAILWIKGEINGKWLYQNHIKMEDFGYRISFLNNQYIAWQQRGLGITHIFQIKAGELVKRIDLNLQLNKTTTDHCLFPTIVDHTKQIIIQKHNQYVYILTTNYQELYKQDCLTIDCTNYVVYGSLTMDAEYLVIWDQGTVQFKVYKIKYE